MPRSPTLNLVASTAAQSLHANQPTDPLSSTATLTPRHLVIPPTRIPFHTPACLIRWHHQPLSGNAALLHPSGPQCSPTAYGSTLFPLFPRSSPRFLPQTQPQFPLSSLLHEVRSFLRNLLLSLFILFLSYRPPSALAVNNHQICRLSFILLSSRQIHPRYFHAQSYSCVSFSHQNLAIHFFSFSF